jgi:hypothetical protein
MVIVLLLIKVWNIIPFVFQHSLSWIYASSFHLILLCFKPSGLLHFRIHYWSGEGFLGWRNIVCHSASVYRQQHKQRGIRRSGLYIRCLLTAIGCHPVAVVQYKFTQKKYTKRHKTNNILKNTKIFGRRRAMPHLCGFYPGICLTTDVKARKNLSQGSRKSASFHDENT